MSTMQKYSVYISPCQMHFLYYEITEYKRLPSSHRCHRKLLPDLYMNTFYYNMLKKIVSQNDMNYVLYDTSLGCFALHCKLIYAQQWTACMLQSLISISKQKQNDTQFLTMEQIIQNEYRKLMDRFSENAVNSKQGLTPVFILLNQ